MSRLTKKNILYHENSVSVNNKSLCVDALNTLGLIEDILEKYDIKDLTELKIALDYYNHRYDGGVYTERVDKNE